MHNRLAQRDKSKGGQLAPSHGLRGPHTELGIEPPCRGAYVSNDKDTEQEQTQKCEMIILLYLKEFLLNWNKLNDCREQIISLKSGCIKALEASLDDDCQSFLQPFEDAMKNFENEKRIMKDVMIEKPRKLTP